VCYSHHRALSFKLATLTTVASSDDLVMSEEQTSKPYPPKPENWSRGIRRIVNGHDASGKGVVLSDLEQQYTTGHGWGIESSNIWTTGETPSKDNNRPTEYDGALEAIPGLGLVRSNGTNCRFTDLAPGGSIPWHRTTSVDYNILIFGSLVSITEDGKEIVLKPGDVVVQRGNLHSWRNPGLDWARWVSVLVDAEPAVVNGESMGNAWRG